MAITANKNFRKNKVGDFREICDRIKTIFIFQKVPSICLNELCSKIFAASDNLRSNYSQGNIYFLILDKLKKILFKFRDLLPDWFKIKEHSTLGNIVLLDNKVHITEILKRLENPELLKELEAESV